MSSIAFRYTCNHCMVAVTEDAHQRHLRILDSIAYDGVDLTNLFVHERGHIQSFDPDGFVVVCDKCFVVELSDNLEHHDREGL